MTRLEYLAELNLRLMDHPGYEPGMEFVFAPPGAKAEEATGFGWLPGHVVEPMRSIALDAAQQVAVIQPAAEASVGREADVLYLPSDMQLEKSA